MFDGIFVTTGTVMGSILNGIAWCLLILCALKCCRELCRPRWRGD